MKRINNQEANAEMKLDAMDRILAAEEEIVPSSGFVAATMERVREEAAVPAPIPFPWKRVAPGLVLAAGVIGWGAWAAVRSAWPALHEFAQSSPQIPLAAMPALEEAGWVALAFAVSLGSWMLSMRLVRRSGLL
ncbi:MAG: hypothetical protein ABR860_10290 [Terracidiphilus sp.]|jgi:hypothetical protein